MCSTNATDVIAKRRPCRLIYIRKSKHNREKVPKTNSTFSFFRAHRKGIMENERRCSMDSKELAENALKVSKHYLFLSSLTTSSLLYKHPPMSIIFPSPFSSLCLSHFSSALSTYSLFPCNVLPTNISTFSRSFLSRSNPSSISSADIVISRNVIILSYLASYLNSLV